MIVQTAAAGVSFHSCSRLALVHADFKTFSSEVQNYQF